MADDDDVRIVPGKEFTRVANALRVIDKKLPGQLRKELRQQVKPLMAKSKDKVRKLPTKNKGRSTGLRRRIARGVGVRIGVGNNPYIRVVTRMANPKEAVIPRGMDAKGWKHPTFGHDPTVTQNPNGHWFVATFADGKKEVQRGIMKVLDDAADYVRKHGS